MAGETKQGPKTLTIILIILAVLLAAAGVVSWLALNDPYAGKGLENVAPSDTLPKKFAENAVARKESSFSMDEVNGYLAYRFQQSGAKTKSGSIQLQAIAVAAASGDSADFYLPTVYRGKRLGVLLNITPSFDASSGKLLFRVNSARVGRLPVPVDWVLGRVENHLPENFSRSGNSLSCDAPSVQASVLQVSASVKLNKFQLADGTLKLAAEASITIG